mgnify:CR=1 FL=1
MIPDIIWFWTVISGVAALGIVVGWQALLWLPGALVRRYRYRQILRAIQEVERAVCRKDHYA